MREWIDHYLQYLTHLKQYSKLTIKSYLNELEQFYMYCKRESFESFDQITYAHVRGYIVYLHDHDLSNLSIRHHISVLRCFFTYLLENDIIQVNPFALVSQPKITKKMPEFLYYDEFEELIDSIDLSKPLGKRNRMIIELMYATGLRVGEAINIKLEDIDFNQGLIMVKGKGGKTRYVPFNPICQQYIEEYIEDTRKELMEKGNEDHPYLFVNQYGRKITERGIYDMLGKVSLNSSLKKKVHPHMLRHTFATHLLDQGADIRIVQEMMGHADLSSTQIYTHVTMDKLKKTYMSAHPLANKSPLNGKDKD